MKFKKRWLYIPAKRLLFLLLLAIPCWGQSGIISANRYTSDWSGAGVVGGIPDAGWTQCGSTISAYTGSGATITAALAGCAANHYVLLGPGTFTINSGGITFPTSGHVVLRGSGSTSTFIVIAAGAGASGCQLGSCLIAATSSDGTYVNQPPPTINSWTATYAKGSTALTFASVTGINNTNPTLVFLEQCETGYTATSATAACTGSAADNGQLFNCADLWTATNVGCSNNGPGNQSTHRGHFEASYATNVAGNVVTIGDPLIYPDWNATANLQPRAWWVQPINTVGVENLSIDDASNGTNDIIQFNSAINWWVTGVRFTNWGRWAVEAFQSEHGTLQSNYFYHSTGSDSYGFRLEVGGENLIQNNIITQVFAPTVLDGSSSGDVLAYNFIINDNYQSDFMRGSLIGHDINGYELLEGNIVNNIAFGDGNHGTDNMTTEFRNFVLGWDSCANGQCGATTAKGSNTNGIQALYGDRYGNYVANVVGTPGFSSTYIDSTNNFSGNTIFELGGANIFPTDPLVKSSSMRWGNWDSVTGNVRWCGNSSDTGWNTICSAVSEVPTGASTFPNSIPTLGDIGAGMGALPASFYLGSRPTWWSPSIPFPAIGPDISGGNIGQCSGALNTAGHQSGMPATSSGQCTGTSLTTPAYGGHVNANPAMANYLSAGGTPDGTGSVLSVNLSYPGTPAPVASFSPSSLTFGNQNINTTSTSQAFTLTNSGNASLTISSISLVTGTQFSQTNNCGGSLAANAFCTITVKFAPTLTGLQSDSVSFSTNVAGSPQLVSLSGTGINPSGIVQLNYTNCASQVFSTTICTMPSTQQGSAVIFGWLSNNDSGAQAVTGVTDNAGDTYTHVPASNSVNTAFGTNADIWWASNVNAGATQIVVTVSPSASGNGAIAQVSNINAIDQVCIANNQASSTTPAGCSVTTTHNSEYIFSISVLQAGATSIFAGNPFTANSFQSGNCSGFYVPSSTGTYDMQCQVTGGGGTFNNSTASFYQASAAPVATFTPTSLAFGNQTFNTPSQPQVITLKNTGNAILTVTSIAFTTGTQFSQTNNCVSLIVNATCTINVTFLPTSLGLKTDSVIVTDNAANSPQAITLTGTGVSAPAPGISLTPSTFSFANQVINTSSSPQAITLKNTGNTNLAITSIGMTIGTQYSQTNNCPSSLGALLSCTINVTFTPNSVGSKIDSVSVVDNATGSPHLATMSGVGVASQSNISPASLAFNNQVTGTTSPAQVITVSNGGTSNLSISMVALTTGTQFADPTNCVTASPIAPNSSCTINVTFSPLTNGLKSDTVTITSNYAGSPQTVGVSGTGITSSAPTVMISPTSLNFGLQLVAPATASQVITLTNTGNANLTVSAVAMTTGTNFTVLSQNCVSGSPIASNGTCTITIQFSPSVVGALSDTVNITDTAANSPQSAAVVGTGVSSTPGQATPLGETVVAH